MINSVRIVLLTIYTIQLFTGGALFSARAASLLSKKTLSQQEFEATLASLDVQTQKNIILHRKEFLTLIEKILKEPEDLTLLVDKQHRLSPQYAPRELTDLAGLKHMHVKRESLLVSSVIIKDLERMMRAAEKEGIFLYAASGYRSYAYQKQTYQRWIKLLGRQEAVRLSAPPGASQHQLGTVVDFFPINNAFTGTPAQRWLAQNACRYGFSLSFPQGHEKQTGYKYESWHYRYLGPCAVEIQEKFFNGLQYKFLTWWHGQRKFYAEKVKN